MSESLDTWTTVKVLDGHFASAPVDRVRSARLGRVWVAEETKAILAMIGENVGVGPSGVAALLIEELRHQGQMEVVWKAHKNRRRRANYHRKYGKNAGSAKCQTP